MTDGSKWRITLVGVNCSECGRRHEFNGEQLAVSKGRPCICGALVVPPASSDTNVEEAYVSEMCRSGAHSRCDDLRCDCGCLVHREGGEA